MNVKRELDRGIDTTYYYYCYYCYHCSLARSLVLTFCRGSFFRQGRERARAVRAVCFPCPSLRFRRDAVGPRRSGSACVLSGIFASLISHRVASRRCRERRRRTVTLSRPAETLRATFSRSEQSADMLRNYESSLSGTQRSLACQAEESSASIARRAESRRRYL